MRLRDALALSRSLSTPPILRRGLLIAILTLLERVFIPIAAWALFGRPLREKVAAAIALGVAFSVRTVAQLAFKARTEADLFDRVVAAMLDADVLRANVLPDEDARAELGQAVYQATQSVSQEIPMLFADTIAVAVLTVVIVVTEPSRLVAVAVAMTLLAAIALFAARRSTEKALANAWTARERVFAGFVDALEGRLEVVASGQRDTFLADMHRRTGAWGAAGVRVAAGTVVAGRLPLLAIAALVAGGVAVAGDRWRSALGVTIADVAVLASMTPAFAGVAQGVLGLARAERWVRIVARVVEGPRAKAGGGKRAPDLPAVIRFDRVSFRYAEMPVDALCDATFAWGPRGVLGLAGANGSGKSTCLRLLLALARPNGGGIAVGGTQLQEVDADAWRAKIAFLPQRPYLPPRSTVRAAVRFLAPDATEERMLQALDRVGLLAPLARGGRDPLDSRVDALSVGERQRVALARLLCRDASLVLLDEPDANLDPAGIALVAELVRELARGAMVALAAHGTELLDVADRIVVLEHGRVIRDEERARLVAIGG